MSEFSAELELAVLVAGANMMAGFTTSFNLLSSVNAPNKAVVATECPTNAICSTININQNYNLKLSNNTYAVWCAS